MVYKRVRGWTLGKSLPVAEQADVNLNFLVSDMDHILNQTSLLNIYVAFVNRGLFCMSMRDR